MTYQSGPGLHLHNTHGTVRLKSIVRTPVLLQRVPGERGIECTSVDHHTPCTSTHHPQDLLPGQGLYKRLLHKLSGLQHGGCLSTILLWPMVARLDARCANSSGLRFQLPVPFAENVKALHNVQIKAYCCSCSPSNLPIILIGLQSMLL